LVEQGTGITSLFETFAGPLLDIYHKQNDVVDDTGGTEIMPDRVGQDELFSNDHDILDNFLFAPANADPLTLKTLNPYPYPTTGADDYIPTGNGVVDLKTTYGTDDGTAAGHVNLFNEKSDFYKDNAQYMINAIRLATESAEATDGNDVPLPYVMIRNSAGVHIEGIDGAGYLAQLKNDTPTDTST
jgi:hypothetical protein